MLVMLLRAALVVVPVVVVYFVWIRPVLKSTPTLKEFYAEADTRWEAIRLKLAGLKQKLVGAVLVAASAAVTCHDELAPLVAGVDFTPITSQVPSWVWPFVVIGSVWALNYCRKLADRRDG